MASTATKLIAAAVGALAGTAIAREVTKPPEERTWHGQVAGVPYDFRPPTPDKLRRTVWDPENPDVFVPHAFGMGWSVNFARIAALVESAPAAPAKQTADG